MTHKRFTRTWRKNTDNTISKETEEADLSIYREMAMLDTKFAIKKLLYDSDFMLTSVEISKIIGIRRSLVKYILYRMGAIEKTIDSKIIGTERKFYVKKPKRNVVEKRKERYNYKTIT